ncbi:AIR synthase-related protein, partial [Candidatus Omnitrophota bacterium]
PEVFWGFRKCCEGISDAAVVLDTPVVSGNVSFYNENPKGTVDPTPAIGMVGVVEDIKKVVTQSFKSEGDAIILLGETKEEIGGSEYLKVIHSQKKGDCPSLDLKKEKALQDTVLAAIDQGLVQSAHDCSDGGLAVTLAESCITGKKIGAQVNLKAGPIRKDALLFGETQSRIILSAKQDDAQKILQLAKKNKVPASVIGKVSGIKLVISDLIDIPVNGLYETWSKAIQKAL